MIAKRRESGNDQHQLQKLHALLSKSNPKREPHFMAGSLHHLMELVWVPTWLGPGLAVPKVSDDPAVLALQDVVQVQVIVHHAFEVHQA